MTSYRIGEVDFDPDASEICVDGHITHLQPQVSSVLVCLVRHKGEVVAKDRLVEEAWEGRCASEKNVTHCISLLRGHLEDRNDRHLIETIPKKGYRLSGTVEQDSSNQSLSPVKQSLLPQLPIYETDEPKQAVNIVLTAAVLFLMLSGMIVLSDFFSLH
ncbi:MAG: winged helix-turn-helix domain-containing protein [Halioglobus sp.]